MCLGPPPARERRRRVHECGRVPRLALHDVEEVGELPHREPVGGGPWARVARVIDERGRAHGLSRAVLADGDATRSADCNVMRYVFVDSDRPAPLQEAEAPSSSPPQPPPPSPAPTNACNEGSPLPRPPLSIAPMMAWTDHHFRQLLRMLTRRTLLYTEMYPVDVVLEAAAAPRDGKRSG